MFWVGVVVGLWAMSGFLMLVIEKPWAKKDESWWDRVMGILVYIVFGWLLVSSQVAVLRDGFDMAMGTLQRSYENAKELASFEDEDDTELWVCSTKDGPVGIAAFDSHARRWIEEQPKDTHTAIRKVPVLYIDEEIDG